jgi:prevent-host-death family protein
MKELRPDMPQIIDRIDKYYDRVMVTRHGHPVAVMMSAGDYESMIETMNVLADKACLNRLRAARKEIGDGKGISLADYKAKMFK